MKLISSSPKTPLHAPQRPAWWVLIAIVAALALSVFRLLRNALEAGLQ